MTSGITFETLSADATVPQFRQNLSFHTVGAEEWKLR